MVSKTLKTRIFASCGLMLFLCVLSNGIGYFGQVQLLKNFANHEKTEKTHAEALEIDRDVQELKSRSESYIHTGAQSQFQTALDLQSTLLSRIDKLESQTENEELSNVLGEMQIHIEEFGPQLKLAAEERDLRLSLVQNELPAAEESIRKQFDLMREMLHINEDDSNSKLLSAEQAFTDAVRHMLKYFISPKASELDLMLAQMQRALNSLSQLGDQSKEDSTDFDELELALKSDLENYRTLAMRAIHATRGYLYYINVVMSGQVSEFVYYSNRLKSIVSQQQSNSRDLRVSSATRTRTYSIVGALIAICVAALLATRLSYSLVNPISQLTRTFNMLSTGQTIEKIEATDRRDEIGRMAQAAQIFSNKNRETKMLLDRSETLSNELSRKAQALEDSNEELDRFAYVASHDLKSPLRGINSLATWVQEDCGDLIPESSKEHLEKMQNRVKKMESLLNDLLEYSRAGKAGEKIELVDTKELVSSIADLSATYMARIELDDNLPTFETARSPLQQVLLNLVTNAAKYNDKSTDGWVRISCDDLGDTYRFSVADNGIGIEPKQHERVFRMYQRVAKLDVEGSGMGLTIVKKQIESYGGEISLESELGRGAKFSFTWPKDITRDKTPVIEA